MRNEYDVIVIGGGHAGVEAGDAVARLGHSCLLITFNSDRIANMPCNPHIGGSAKGIVVREIDALGGVMGVAADEHPLQIKMLNTGKGPAVQCLRSQQDKKRYPSTVRRLLANSPNLDILEDEVVSLSMEEGQFKGTKTKNHGLLRGKAVVLACGTYLDSKVYVGSVGKSEGPDGEPSSSFLSTALKNLNIATWRLKTGTPPRLDKKSIDFSKAQVEPGMGGELAFSYRTKCFTPLEKQLPCYLIYTNEKTHAIIMDNLSSSALFNGVINSTGPRYCPSIESKVTRFADKPRHQLFLEPEYEEGDSIYLQGFSTALPKEIQVEMVHSLPGLENAVILKYAYQIEYEAIRPEEFDVTLALRRFPNVFIAGQICGTSGYEEAAGLGLVAGTNAVKKIEGKEPLVLHRNEAYIGVMIDDLVTKGIDEPYRLLSSRAEYRLLLRHDNADERLTEIGYRLGLVSEEEHDAFLWKQKRIGEAISILKTTTFSAKDGLAELFANKGLPYEGNGIKGFDLLKRPGFTYSEIQRFREELLALGLSGDEILCLETKVKFEGYLAREKKEAENLLKQDAVALPGDIDYLHTSRS